MQPSQELAHSADHDYRETSPHLKHWHLYDLLVSKLRGVLDATRAAGVEQHLLDVGAGEGSFVEPALSSGYRVTALEMSRPSLDRLRQRYGANPNFLAEFDGDGSLSVIGDNRYGVILYASVLHHIPNYMTAVDNAISRHLEPGGSFVSFQDPLLYASVPGLTRQVGRIAYFWWRLSRGNYRRGIATRARRLRGRYDEGNPADMAEYHVVRSGVDQDGIVHALHDRFEQVTLVPYWSTQSGIWQRIGEMLRLQNTFAIVAVGYHGYDRRTATFDREPAKEYRNC